MPDSPWLAAVREVPHAPTCSVTLELANAPYAMMKPRYTCTCDRDARIAKGVEAAVRSGVGAGFTMRIDPDVDVDAAALRAFREASAL